MLTVGTTEQEHRDEQEKHIEFTKRIRRQGENCYCEWHLRCFTMRIVLCLIDCPLLSAIEIENSSWHIALEYASWSISSWFSSPSTNSNSSVGDTICGMNIEQHHPWTCWFIVLVWNRKQSALPLDLQVRYQCCWHPLQHAIHDQWDFSKPLHPDQAMASWWSHQLQGVVQEAYSPCWTLVSIAACSIWHTSEWHLPLWKRHLQVVEALYLWFKQAMEDHTESYDW